MLGHEYTLFKGDIPRSEIRSIGDEEVEVMEVNTDGQLLLYQILGTGEQSNGLALGSYLDVLGHVRGTLQGPFYHFRVQAESIEREKRKLAKTPRRGNLLVAMLLELDHQQLPEITLAHSASGIRKIDGKDLSF